MNSTITKFIALLKPFSSKELLALERILRDNNLSTHLADMVRNYSNINKGLSFQNDNNSSVRISRISSRTKLNKGEQFTDNAYDDILSRILMDEHSFPTMDSLINFISANTNLNIDLDIYKKRGRRDLVRKMQNEMNKLPNSKRHDILRRLADHTRNNSSLADYTALFNLLVK